MANVGQAQFTSLQAATTDYFGPGAIFVPEFQREINDLVRRAGVLGQRIMYVPATGAPSRWYDETAIQDGQVTDPRNITPTATAPTRQENSLLIKAITNRIDYSLFDLETVRQQGIFNELKAKDLQDMVNGILRLRDKNLWTGSDTVSGNQVGTSAATAYVGLLNQITQTVVIDTTATPAGSIVDGIRTQVAKMVANASYVVRPTAIYMNPLLVDLLEQEAKNSNNALKFNQDGVEVVAGLRVPTMMTAAGILPIIPEPFLPLDATIPGIAAAGSGKHNYPFAIITENLVEFHYVGSKIPRVLQLGTIANLNESYVGIHFGSPVVKSPGYAHTVGVVVHA